MEAKQREIKMSKKLLIPAAIAAAYIFSPSEAQAVEAEEGYFVPEGEFKAEEDKKPAYEGKKSTKRSKKSMSMRGKASKRSSSLPPVDDIIKEFVQSREKARVDELERKQNNLTADAIKAQGERYQNGGAFARVSERQDAHEKDYDALKERVEQNSQRRTLGFRLGASTGATVFDGTPYMSASGRIGIILPHLADKLNLKTISIEGEVGRLFGNYSTRTTTTESNPEPVSVGPTYLQRNREFEELTKKDSYKIYELLRIGAEFPIYGPLSGELALQMAGYHGEQKPSVKTESTTQLLDQNENPLEEPVTVPGQEPDPRVVAGRDLDAMAMGTSVAAKLDITSVGQAVLRAVARGEFEPIVVSDDGKHGRNYKGSFGLEADW